MTEPAAEGSVRAPRSAVRRWLSNLSLLSKSRLIILALLALFVGACIAFLSAQNRESEAREWTLHTYKVLAAADRSQAILLDMRRQLRDGLIGADESRVDAYLSASALYEHTLSDLRNLVGNNQAQVQRSDDIERLRVVWSDVFVTPAMQRLHQSQQLRQSRGDDDFLNFLRAGDAAFDPILGTLGQLRAVEQGLLDQRLHELDLAAARGRDVVLAALLSGLLGSLYALIAARRTLAQPLIELTQLIPRISERGNVGEIPYRWRRDEVGDFARSLGALAQLVAERDAEHWLQTHLATLAGELQLAGRHESFGEALLRSLSPPLTALRGRAWRWNAQTGDLDLCAVHVQAAADAVDVDEATARELAAACMAQAQTLQVAVTLREPADKGSSADREGILLGAPLFVGSEIAGFVEWVLRRAPSAIQSQLLERALGPSALAWQRLARSIRTTELLDVTRIQAAQLQASEDEQRRQTAQLRLVNESLREKTAALSARQAELEAVRAKLERHAAELERASRYKSEFLANMSHELRTPLNSLLILSKALAANDDGNLLPDQIENARIVHDSGHQLLKLINDLLDLSSMETGGLVVEAVDIDLRAFAAAQEQRFRAAADEQRIDFAVRVDDALPAAIRSDETRLAQIVGNLLSNAFKFTPQGEVRLHLRRPQEAWLRRAGLAGVDIDQAICFAVNDTGIGIPRDRLDAVFQAFEQVESGTSRRFGGGGLGLPLSRGMAQRLGGDLIAESYLGEGSSFLLILPERHEPAADAVAVSPGPRAPALRAPAAKPVTEESEASGTRLPARPMMDAMAPTRSEVLRDIAGRHLLIVDDDLRGLFALSKTLRAQQLQVTMAQDGYKALTQLEANPAIGLVLMDILMPGMDGLETIARMREREAWKSLPIVALTARPTAGDRERCLQAGADDYCVKPVEIDALMSLIRRWIR